MRAGLKSRLVLSSLAALAFSAIACGGGSSSTGTGGTAGAGGNTTSSPTGGAGGNTTSSQTGGTGGTGGDTTSSPTGGSGGTGGNTTSSPTGGTGGAAGDIDTFTADAAGAICGALFKCCDAQSLTDYFGPYAQSTLLSSFASKIPPQHTFANEAECAATVKQMLDITPFGDWVSAVKAGHVTFDAAAFATCKSTLENASCGKEVAGALTDGTCLGFGAPPGGKYQRKSFVRTQKAGDPCAPIRDGVGAGFFGSCDPTGTFCCYEDAASPGKCALPFDKNGNPRAGTCKAASKVGEGCTFFNPVQVCVTGASCDSGTDKCVADGDAPLSVGQGCVDQNFNVLGICQQSYCDVLGTGKCEPLKADGVSCGGPEECQSGGCPMGKCGAPTFCTGK
jgi:hypothetical protein